MRSAASQRWPHAPVHHFGEGLSGPAGGVGRLVVGAGPADGDGAQRLPAGRDAERLEQRPGRLPQGEKEAPRPSCVNPSSNSIVAKAVSTSQ